MFWGELALLTRNGELVCRLLGTISCDRVLFLRSSKVNCTVMQNMFWLKSEMISVTDIFELSTIIFDGIHVLMSFSMYYTLKKANKQMKVVEFLIRIKNMKVKQGFFLVMFGMLHGNFKGVSI